MSLIFLHHKLSLLEQDCVIFHRSPLRSLCQIEQIWQLTLPKQSILLIHGSTCQSITCQSITLISLSCPKVNKYLNHQILRNIPSKTFWQTFQSCHHCFSSRSTTYIVFYTLQNEMICSSQKMSPLCHAN